MKRFLVLFIMGVAVSSFIAAEDMLELMPGEMLVTEITVNPDYPNELYLQDGYVVLSLDSAVMQASYTYYLFDPDNFKAFFGDYKKMKKPVTVKAVLIRLADQNYTPEDEMMQSPSGGFENIKYFVLIKSKK